MQRGQHYIPLPGMRFQCRRPASHSAPASRVVDSEARTGGGEDVEILGRGRDACEHGWLFRAACVRCRWRRCLRSAALHDRKVVVVRR